MANPLQNAALVSRRADKRLGGVFVVVRRGEKTFEALATKGESRFEHTTDEGFVFETRRVDWMIDVLDYDFGDGPVRPKAGDQLTEVVGFESVVFTVLPDESENAFSFSDRDTRLTYRLHTLESSA